MTYYWLQMTQLPQTHPEADLFLRSGGFSVQRSNNSFAMVPSDQAIEQSMNRATKTTGGIVGFSRHPGTVQRWVLTAHDRAAVADVCMEHCGLDDATEERDTMHKLAVIKLRNFHRPDIMSCHFAFCPDMSGQYFICHFFSNSKKTYKK